VRPADLQRLTVRDAVDRYADMVRAKAATGALSPGTAEVYIRDALTFAALTGPERVLDDLDGTDVDGVLLAFARKPDGRRRHARPVERKAVSPAQSTASQARFRRSVSAFFQYAAISGWIQLNPMQTVTVIARPRGGLPPQRRALTREQAEGLLGAAQRLASPAGPAERRRVDQRTGLRDALIVLLLATVGPRVSELTRADVEDFYVNAGVRYWRIFGKGGRTRDVPLPHQVVRVLDAHLAERRANAPAGEKALLLSWRGKRLARGDAQAVIDRVLARVDPERRRTVTPHGLRHTTATHLLAAATDMDAVRRVLGHADLSTLGRYRDELPGELEAAMRAHPLLQQSDDQ
jgi:site-specific recombinase XerD